MNITFPILQRQFLLRYLPMTSRKTKICNRFAFQVQNKSENFTHTDKFYSIKRDLFKDFIMMTLPILKDTLSLILKITLCWSRHEQSQKCCGINYLSVFQAL